MRADEFAKRSVSPTADCLAVFVDTHAGARVLFIFIIIRSAQVSRRNPLLSFSRTLRTVSKVVSSILLQNLQQVVVILEICDFFQVLTQSSVCEFVDFAAWKGELSELVS